MDQRNRFRLESLGIFLFALLLFTLGIWDQQPQGFDGRWALFLQEMFRHGASLFPTTYGQPYADYPGTATFFSFVFARLFGAPNHLANVLPTALASAGVIALLYRLLVPASRQWALLSVLLTLLTTQLLEKSRSVCLDQMVALLCVGSFYLLHSGERLGSRLRQLAVFPLAVFVDGHRVADLRYHTQRVVLRYSYTYYTKPGVSLLGVFPKCVYARTVALRPRGVRSSNPICRRYGS